MSFELTIPLYTIRHKLIGGTEFAIYNLINGLAETDAKVKVVYGHDSDISSEFLQWLEVGKVESERTGGLPGPKNVRFFEETLFEWRLKPTDWVLYPNYFLPPQSHRHHNAVILHDIQYKVLPQYHTAKRKAWLDFYLPSLFKRARSVILISKSEYGLVREHFGEAAAAKCDVVPNAIDWSRFETDAPAPSVLLDGKPYILSVCHQFPHKNITTLLSAFAVVARSFPDLQLALIGSASDANRRFLESSLPSDLLNRVSILGFVSDAELGGYYSQAALFVLPSLYEGFGMPAIEALGMGVPTLTSKSTALPEVTLGLADYVANPTDVDEWVSQISVILNRQDRPSASAVNRIRQAYRPDIIAQRAIEVLQRRARD